MTRVLLFCSEISNKLKLVDVNKRQFLDEAKIFIFSVAEVY